jgi:hypothetical protein
MKGTLHKKEEGWIVKWSDLHSFAHGTHWQYDPLHDDDQSSPILVEDKEIEFDIEYSEDFKSSWARLSDIYKTKKDCEKFICEWVSDFLTENIEKLNTKKCDLSNSGTSKEKLLKDVKKDISWAMWVLNEVMNWGMDKDYTIGMTVYEPEDYEFRVIKLNGKYIKIIYNKDFTHTVSFAKEKTKLVTYFD